jgi:asparagine synthase (glutamine-hydrolysing)
MCGIFGIINGKESIDITKLQEVSKALRHRGPDDEGYLLTSTNKKTYHSYKGDISPQSLILPHISTANGNYNIAFLHRRLSIIDLSDTGHQPMSYAERYWIILNGEIYNYLEIKEELLKKGYSFKSSSDTEVVLAAYIEWGKDCVLRFNGMWAFVLWDCKENSFLLSRDRFGVKPLYYYFKNNVFIFCSEIKGIRTYLNNNILINSESVNKFLDIGEFSIGEIDDTMFYDIKQLLPGHNIIFKENSLKIIKYWNLELKETTNTIEENIEIFKELFLNSIKLRLRSDVEVGSCLSGGIDSSSIVSYASSKFNRKMHTFSIIWPGEKCDESFYIDTVNKKYDCTAHAFKPELNDVLEIIDKVIWHQELPLATGSLLAQWFVMRKANKEGIKVLLDGQGADEVLAGYPRFIRSFLNEMILGFSFKTILENKELLRQYGYSTKSYLSVFKTLIFNKLFKQNNNNIFKSLNDNLKSEMEISCLPSLLHYEDRNSMAHSIESRVPFLDFHLVEFLFSIPASQKIKNSRTKFILINAMKDYLPPEIYNRRDKIGFETPIEKYLQGNKSYANYDWTKDKVLKNYNAQNNLRQFNEIEKKFKYFSLSCFLTLYS